MASGARSTSGEGKGRHPRDALAAERRRLPVVKIDKDYVFEGDHGKARLIDMFEGHRQLIMYHVMFGPTHGLDVGKSVALSGT